MVASSMVDHGFEPPLGQTKDYDIGICYFSAMHAALRSKDWLVQNQDIVFEWSDISIHWLLFQWATHYKNPTNHVGLVQSGHHHHDFSICKFYFSLTIEIQIFLWYNINFKQDDINKYIISMCLFVFI
jgi:hypothetical protein